MGGGHLKADHLAADRLQADQLKSDRLQSIDMLRGLVIVLMALDHARLGFGYTSFYPTDITMSTTGFFFTRWITHFCAPVFVLLAGTGTYLYGQRINNTTRLSRFLLTRGLWLIFLEIVWINLWFNAALPWASGIVFVQVIWVLGVSMIVLAGLIHLPMGWIVGLSTVLIVGHNGLDGISTHEVGSFADLWAFLHLRTLVSFNVPVSFQVFVAYPLIPWIGVMGLGYALGTWMLLDEDSRRKRLMYTGLGLTAAFFLLRLINVYGDPVAWMVRREGFFSTILSFINTTKYPPSLLFLLMTLGPALLILAWFERLNGWTRRVMLVFGKVPMFFYLVHIPLIVLTSVGFWYLTFDRVIFFLAGGRNIPAEYEPSLVMVYVAWFLISLVLYPVCKFYGQYKFSVPGRRKRWLRYF